MVSYLAPGSRLLGQRRMGIRVRSGHGHAFPLTGRMIWAIFSPKLLQELVSPPVVAVQLLSCVRLFAILWTAAHQASLCPGICSCPSSQWCHSNISSSVIPFSSCLQSFPASDKSCNGANWRISFLPFLDVGENPVILAKFPKSETPFWILEFIFINWYLNFFF